MWVLLAFISACFLGLYDVAKKTSLRGNAVLPVLATSTAVSALIFLPVILSSVFGLGLFGDSILAIHRGTLQELYDYFSKNEPKGEIVLIVKGGKVDCEEGDGGEEGETL